ncbi:MAG: DUF4276 family protein [Desulfovibrio sp.]|jgi:hypothetical protein|nr:DUF4276 family protein [Desulfovibrio sp.]
MIRLHITAEGPTEKRFAQKVLTPHLAALGVFVDTRSVLTSKDNRNSKEYRGGLISYAKAKNDIQAWLKEDCHTECRFTTMFDLYALPTDFPGYTEATLKTDKYERVRFLEEKLGQDIADRRFIPYIQLHEFEALILADPRHLDWEYLEYDRQIQKITAMVGAQNPELINDGPDTAPSKRILQEIPEYDKATAGPAVAEKIGLSTLRAKCYHFNEWLSRLESLDVAQGEPLLDFETVARPSYE